MKTLFKYIYGPVFSWRLGSSLGIDLLSQKEKICNFDCVYCQIGATHAYTVDRKVYLPVRDVTKEARSLPPAKIDYITFSGRGEPTLAANLGEAIVEIKTSRKEPVAVITNGSLIWMDEVRKELLPADFVIIKMDAYSQESLKKINRPFKGVVFDKILNGVKEFRKGYLGRLALQIMFIEGAQADIDEYIYLVNSIKPDEVQINTPLRRCHVKSLGEKDVFKIRDRFALACKGVDIISVYNGKSCKGVESISDEDTLRRRGKIR